MCSCEDYPFLYVWQCGWKRGCVEASNKANKWQNKHRQSWFRPLIQCCTDMSSSYSLMMHLPGCFLLTRLFQGYPFYRARWCHCKVFWVSHPRPHLPLQSVSCVLQVYCVLCVCMCEAREEELSNMHSKKKSTFCCCWYFSPKKDNAFHCLAFMILSWLHVRSTLQMLTNHYPFHGDSFLLPIH